jgi:hypothetical protein
VPDATKRSSETERATAGVLANRMLVVNLPIVLQQLVLVKFRQALKDIIDLDGILLSMRGASAVSAAADTSR